MPGITLIQSRLTENLTWKHIEAVINSKSAAQIGKPQYHAILPWRVPAVVDLPTPPFPEEIAIIFSTPNTMGLLITGPRFWFPVLLENSCRPLRSQKPCCINKKRSDCSLEPCIKMTHLPNCSCSITHVSNNAWRDQQQTPRPHLVLHEGIPHGPGRHRHESNSLKQWQWSETNLKARKLSAVEFLQSPKPKGYPSDPLFYWGPPRSLAGMFLIIYANKRFRMSRQYLFVPWNNEINNT